MKKRILAWIALIVFVALLVNVMFIHYHVTESLTIMMFYVLFLIYKKRQDNAVGFTEENKTDEPENSAITDEEKETDENPDKTE